MASRTNNTEVKIIIPTALTDAEIDSLIIMANRMVNNTLDGEGLSAALTKDIETWMTAHLIAIGKERQVETEKIGDIWVSYTENPSGFLQSTTFGQMVLSLDPTGNFQKTTMKKVSFNAIKQITP